MSFVKRRRADEARKARPTAPIVMLLRPDTAPEVDFALVTAPTNCGVRRSPTQVLPEHSAFPAGTRIVVVEVDAATPAAGAWLDRFLGERPDGMRLIVLARNPSVAFTRRALLAGADDVLPLPLSIPELQAAIARMPRGAERKLGEPTRRGKIVTLVGARGGVGGTTIATQAGLLWAGRGNVALVDLDLQHGNAALYLDLRPQLTMSDALDAGDRLDADYLRSLAERHPSGLAVLAAPREVTPLDAIEPEFVRRIIGFSADCFDVTLVDTPGCWTEWSRDLLELSDVICLVTTLSVAGIYQAKRQIEVIAANGFSDKLQLILNRVTHPLLGKLDLSETEALVGRRVDHVLADDASIVVAVEKGVAIGSVKPRSRAERDLKAMVAALSDNLAAAMPEAA